MRNKIPPAQAKKAIIIAANWLVGVFETLESIEQGAHPLVAVKEAVRKAKKRKKKEKIGKRLRKSQNAKPAADKDYIDV